MQGDRRWGYVFLGALGFGLLAKGPVVFPLVALPVVLWWAASPSRLQQLHAIRRQLPWITGTLLMLAIALPWYVAAELRTPGFLDYFLLGEHVQRFLKPNWQGDLYGSAHPAPKGMVWVFLAYAACTWLPLWLATWIKRAPRAPDSAAGSSASGSADRYLAMWVFATPVFFTLAGNTIWSYALPSLPAFALWLARRVCAGAPPVNRLTLLTAVLGTVAMAVLYLVWLPRPEVSNERSTRDMIRAAQAAVAPHPHALLVMIHAQPHSTAFYSAREVVTLTHDDALSIMRRGEPAAIMATDEHLTGFLMEGWLPRVLRERTWFVGRYGKYTLLVHPPSPPDAR
jgi:4-amino-4-deoxy-L-arabinose transferase-like glycosyltransferase